MLEESQIHFRKEGEEWKSSKSFRANELLQVAYLANQAYERAL